MKAPVLPRGYEHESVLRETEHVRVSVARAPKGRGRVVVKVLSGGAPESTRNLFLEDVRLRGELLHDGISPILESGPLAGGAFYAVSPFVETTDPHRWISRAPSKRAAEFIRRLAEPIAFLHERGHLHGDIKPSNLLFRAEAEEVRELRLTDTLPRAFRRGGRFGMLVGTPAYLAPEAFRGEEIDARSDLYSLGVTLFEIFTGEALFSGDPVQLARSHLLTPARGLLPAGSAIPKQVWDAIAALLEKEPADRPASASELVEMAVGRGASRPAVVVPALPPLVGREEIVGRFRAWLESEGKNCFLLSGPRGSGRTRLLRRFVSDLRFEGRSVVALAGPEGEAVRPFEGARRLFEAAGAEVPFLRAEGPDRPKDAREPHLLRSADDEVRLFRALRERWERRIREMAPGESAPVVVIDDVDRFDGFSLRLVVFLALRSRDASACFVFSRAEPAPAAGQDPLAELGARGLLRVEHLAPLGPGEVSAWLRGALGSGAPADDLVAEAHEASGGNPARLEATVREWAARGLIRRRQGAIVLLDRAGPLPPGAAEPQGRIDASDLSPRRKEVAGAIALAASPRPARFFERLLSVRAGDFPGLVAPLIERGLVLREETPRGDIYSLARVEVRDAVEALIPERRRRSLHREAARLMEEEGSGDDPAPLVEAALHWEKAGVPGSAARALLRAASAMERLSLAREAARLYRRALVLPNGIRSPIERGKALYALAYLRQRHGEPRGALAALRLLDRTIGSDAKARSIRLAAVRLAAWVRFLRGKSGEAEATLARLLGETGILDGKDEAAVLCDLGWFSLSRGSVVDARSHLNRALSVLKGSGSPVLRARALNRLGAAAFYESEWREAASFYSRAVRLFERSESSEAVGALANLALVHLWTGSLRSARASLEKARAHASRGADAVEEARIVEDLARVLFRLGEVEEASTALEEARSTYVDFRHDAGVVRVLLTNGQMARERGRLDRSLDLLMRGLALARAGAKPYALFDAYNLLALTHLAREETDAAGEAVREAADALGERLTGRYEAILERTIARLAAARGGYDEAEKRLERATRLFFKRGERLMAAETLLLEAQVRLDRPGMPTPQALLDRAAGLAKETECPWLECRLALLQGRCAEKRQDPGAAAALYRDATQIARRLDARLDLAESLARLGAASAKRGERRRAQSCIEEATALYDLMRVVSPPEALAEARLVLQAPEEEGGESFRVLCRISEIINSFRDTDAILEHVLDQAIDHLRAERGLILLYTPDGQLAPSAARGLDGEDLKDASRFSRTLFARAEESEEPLVADNALADPRFDGAESVAAFNILSVACTPLRSRGKPIGLIYVDNCRTPNLFSKGDLTFLRALANLAGVALENARLLEDLRRENVLFKEEADRRARESEMIAESPAARKTVDLLRKSARSDVTILLLGETGAGKGLAAHFIHRESPRRDQPFLRMNCAAIAPSLVEDELFGHEPGSFTDARERKAGIFERAHLGTLLLDEIGDMPLSAQGKLLRVLQEGEYERLGGTETLRTNVRIIAATNRALSDLAASGGFRYDLYYRLNVVTIEIPPLRARREDIPALARYFLDRHARRNRKDVRSISGAAESLLRSYDWPGNVRELDHVIERAVIFSDGRRIEAAHLTEEVRSAFPGEGLFSQERETDTRHLPRELRSVESELLRDALARSGWNRSKAARLLGIHESTVRKKIRLLHLDRFRPTQAS